MKSAILTTAILPCYPKQGLSSAKSSYECWYYCQECLEGVCSAVHSVTQSVESKKDSPRTSSDGSDDEESSLKKNYPRTFHAYVFSVSIARNAMCIIQLSY